MPSTADVVSRETEWLNTSGDGLPALNASAGGPFGVVSGYWPRTPATMKTSLYVTRTQTAEERTAHIRIMARHRMVLHALWPLNNTGGSAELDQQNLDDAVEQVLGRIRGFPHDHSHGGRFLSAGEHPGAVTVAFTPASETVNLGIFKATITYTVDDFELFA
ncbi:hypothetical protein KGQ20_02125 [Catenulispora sp. NF23]|uniref:Uncharacterized protein n=1 Tax=Catenulispora pinistramenti TaxID=2705254 RepID=A0ABS5KIR9_9ACTN|nr:hypothetical protein [Catenulispora pinistramenti]MBS2531562.1 hypothetical protein [Catenulispora pinistramenti]MBS2546188.1 hypothetical protein [Catenulispora pinistramenti]